jgi:hypothetical protein
MTLQALRKALKRRIEEAQRKVAAGEIDLRPIGEALFGKWDQDYIAETLAVAKEALALTVPGETGGAHVRAGLRRRLCSLRS